MKSLFRGPLFNSFLGGAPSGGAPAPAAPAAPAPAAPAPAAPAPDAPAPAPTPPGNTPPAPAPTFRSLFAEATNADGTYKEGWTQSLADQGLTGLANRLSSFKDEASAMRSLDHAVRLIGARPEVGPPKPGAPEVAVQAYRDAAGVPADVGGYELETVLPKGMEPSDELKGWSEQFHEHHIPKEVAQAFVKKEMERRAETSTKALETFDTQLKTHLAENEQLFRKEWGDHYEQRLQDNRDFVRTLNLDVENPAVKLALSMPFVVKAIDAQRKALRGVGLPGDGREAAGGSESPRQQAQKIIAANPNYKSNPILHAQVKQLYALDAQRNKRK